jgi:DNA-directed RNA polymerase specialized sigma24 family protein
MVVYSRYDVDRLYRSLPDADNLWLTQPSYDSQPRERRPVDELPGDVTEYLTRLEALERIPHTQRLIFRAVVMGIVRNYDPRRGDYVDVRVRPMTYAECARVMDLTEGAVYQALRRGRDNLAKILSDRDEEAA